MSSWQIEGEKVGAMTGFILLDYKVTVNGSHEIKGHLLLGREVMINLDSTIKSRDLNLPTRSV